MRTTVGQSRTCAVRALVGNEMVNELKTFKNKKGKPGMPMKIRFDCPTCGRSWSSGFGNTQWYYKLDVRKSQTGGLLGCTLKFKVHTYA